MPGREELPSTLRRSPKAAQQIWIKTHDSAVEAYGEGRRSHQTAFAALKHSFEKVGDHWERKARKGPSDAQAEKRVPASARTAARGTGKTAEGVNANAPKRHLYEVAAKLGINGRSRMDKEELISAIKRANRRKTAQARSRHVSHP